MLINNNALLEGVLAMFESENDDELKRSYYAQLPLMIQNGSAVSFLAFKDSLKQKHRERLTKIATREEIDVQVEKSQNILANFKRK